MNENAGLIAEIGKLHKDVILLQMRLKEQQDDMEVLRQAVFQLVAFVKTIQERLLQIGGGDNP